MHVYGKNPRNLKVTSKKKKERRREGKWVRGRDTEYVKPDNIYREKADAHAKRDHIKKKKKEESLRRCRRRRHPSRTLQLSFLSSQKRIACLKSNRKEVTTLYTTRTRWLIISLFPNNKRTVAHLREEEARWRQQQRVSNGPNSVYERGKKKDKSS